MGYGRAYQNYTMCTAWLTFVANVAKSKPKSQLNTWEREREKEGEQQRCTTNRVINVKMAHTTTVNDAKKIKIEAKITNIIASNLFIFAFLLEHTRTKRFFLSPTVFLFFSSIQIGFILHLTVWWMVYIFPIKMLIFQLYL